MFTKLEPEVACAGQAAALATGMAKILQNLLPQGIIAV
jgi:hypothetical protein